MDKRIQKLVLFSAQDEADFVAMRDNIGPCIGGTT